MAYTYVKLVDLENCALQKDFKYLKYLCNWVPPGCVFPVSIVELSPLKIANARLERVDTAEVGPSEAGILRGSSRRAAMRL